MAYYSEDVEELDRTLDDLHAARRDRDRARKDRDAAKAETEKLRSAVVDFLAAVDRGFLPDLNIGGPGERKESAFVEGLRDAILNLNK